MPAGRSGGCRWLKRGTGNLRAADWQVTGAPGAGGTAAVTGIESLMELIFEAVVGYRERFGCTGQFTIP